MRKNLYTFGSHGSTIRVFVEKGGDLVRVQWREDGRLKSKSWDNTGENRRIAKAWAESFSKARELPTPTERPRITIREMWEAYKLASFPTLRTKTKSNYETRFEDWENFAGKNFVAELTTLEMLDEYRAERTKMGYSVAQTGEHFKIIKLVYAWAHYRGLIAVNRVSLYKYKIAKEDRTKGPDEYLPDDFPKLVAQLDPRNGRQWRAWVAIVLCGTQGARINAILHLHWDDVDFENKTIRWRPEWDKMGHDRTQPLTPLALEALLVALGYSIRDKDQSGWILYTPTKRKQKSGGGCYGVQSFWRMLRLAEDAAGIEHKPRRAAHGLRKMAAGNALQVTGNIADAMWWIGDTDLRQGKKYLKEREDRMRNIADNLPKVELQTVTKP